MNSIKLISNAFLDSGKAVSDFALDHKFEHVFPKGSSPAKIIMECDAMLYLINSPLTENDITALNLATLHRKEYLVYDISKENTYEANNIIFVSWLRKYDISSLYICASEEFEKSYPWQDTYHTLTEIFFYIKENVHQDSPWHNLLKSFTY